VDKSLLGKLVCSLAVGVLIAGGVAGAEGTPLSGPVGAASVTTGLSQPHVAGVVGGADLAAFENGRVVGTGNGKIHIIPALSAPSVKNGDRVCIQAVVKALNGVAKVEARIEPESDASPSWELAGLAGLPVDTLELKGAPLNAGGVNAAGTTGIWQAEWLGSGLEEGYYRIAITVTDKAGNAYTDRSLVFSDPVAGLNTAGSSVYPNAGMRRLDKSTMAGGTLFRCATGDTAAGYAYFGTDTSPGIVVKVALGTGATPPSQVAYLTLNTNEDKLSSVLIDTVNGYAYFGTYTAPGRVVKVALGTGPTAPARIGAAVLLSGEDNLTCATGNAASGYVLFGTYTTPGRVVKVATPTTAAPPTRAGGVTLNTGENSLSSAVSDLGDGYAYFGTYTSPGIVVKVAVGAGAAAPARTAALTLPTGENLLTSAVADAANNYAYFGTYTSPAMVVKVAMGAGTAAPTQAGVVTLGTGENQLLSARIDLTDRYAYFGTGTSPGTVVKVALGAAAAAPTRAGALTLNSGENMPYGMLIDLSAGFVYLGTYTNPGAVVRAGLTQKGFLKATKFTLYENGGVGSVSFYSHAASGSMRLAIYDNSTSPALVWESPSTANATPGGWQSVPIASGAPNSLLLTPGTYWLGWQVDVTTPVPSWTAGTAVGDGLLMPMLYGACPASLATGSTTATDERWSEYITYWAPPAPASNPTAPALDITRNSIKWSWTDNSSDETGFQVYDEPGAGPPNPATSLQTVTAANTTSWKHNGLVSNTMYAFQVCATNLYGNSAPTSNITVWTLATAPSAPLVDTPTVNSLNVTLGSDVNPVGTVYAIYVLPAVNGYTWVQANGTVGAGSVNRTAADWGTTKVTGLSPSTTYNFYIRATNGAGVNTVFSPTVAGTTLAVVPPAPTVDNAYVHSLDVTVNAGTNSVFTTYAIQVVPDVGGNTWVQADGSVGAGAVYQTVDAWGLSGKKTVTGLAAARTYSFYVGAKNTAGMYTAFGSPGSGATLASLAVTADPSGGSIYVGDSFPLSVTTTGGRAPLTYLWQKDGTDINTATLSTLTVNPATLADSGTYKCRVRDAGSENVLSGGAALTVSEHVSFTAPPAGGAAYVGTPYTFTVGVTGGIGTLRYQWTKDGVEIPGKTSNTLSFESLAMGDSAAYACRVRDAVRDDFTSEAASLTVAEHVSFAPPPSGGAAYTGDDYTFSVGVTGGIGTLTYQWYKDGAEITDATSATLALTGLGSGDAATYTCRVRDAQTDDKTSPEAVLTVSDHVFISTDPVGATLYAGDPFALTVGATGGIGTLTYQWYKDGVEITDATSDMLSFTSLVTGDSASYTCRVRDARTDDKTSLGAVLAVSEHVAFAPPPEGWAAYTGEDHTFSVGVTGGIGALTYQWYKDGAEITDATSDSLSLTNLGPGDVAAYTCRVRDAQTDDKTSPEAALTVSDHLLISADPVGATLYAGDPYTFTVGVTGGIGTLRYQWYKDGTEIADATSETLPFTSLVTGDSASYTCRVRDARTDDQTSLGAALAVAEHVEFATPPAGGSAYTGEDYTFTVGVTGGIGALTYQWYRGGVEITDATLDTLALTGLVPGDAAAYTCRVRDAQTDDKTSPEAALAVADRISITTEPQNQTVAKKGTVSFTVTAAGGFAPLHYRWMKDGTTIPGGPDAPEFTIHNAVLDDAGNYSVEVFDSKSDSITSNEASLTLVNGVPVAGVPGLAALALAAALAGVRTLRRKRQ